MRLLAVAVVLLALPAGADPLTQCRVVDVQFTPASSKLQIVGWIEDAAGAYKDTIYITKQTGLYGLGNRPGRFDFNSGPNWPYGRRITVFPIWSHRHGTTFMEVDFQNADDSNLSHPLQDSSQEFHYCRPMEDSGPDGPSWDAGTCATGFVGTDKGVFSSSGATSNYPPRTDVVAQMCAGTPPPCDSPAVSTYASMVPWDAVSAATPAAGMPVDVSWTIPPELPPGSYVAWIETSLEQDFNSSYSCTPSGTHWTTPCTISPPPVSFSSYGEPYRGQPSIVYRVPFTIGTTEMTASTDTYAGYGEPNGADGNVRPPDGTITTGTPGSGGSRLQLVSASGSMYRVLVDAHAETITMPPDAPTNVQAVSSDASTVTISFVAPGDTQSPVKGYEVRVRANDPITDANFTSSMPIAASFAVAAPGQTQTFDVTGLLPATQYYVGVRAYDLCHNTSAIGAVAAKTADAKVGEVSWCFVATAAYGSTMANEVDMLRTFRDRALRGSVLGELAIESYYTFGPAVAGVVGESELLRATARGVLEPIVRVVRAL